MRIAVCVKEVPDASARKAIDPNTKRLVREGDQALNPFDTHAIEAGLQVREELGDSAEVRITAFCMAPESATRALQKTLALGADDAVHISDPTCAGSDIVATSRVLAAAIKSAGEFDLVLMGQQAADSDCWVMPAVLAEMLGLPVLTQAAKMRIEDGAVSVERQSELGYERLRAKLPAVVSVSDAINEPRYPSLKAIMAAKRKPVERRTLADIGLAADAVGEAGSRTVVTALAQPPQREKGALIEDDGSAAQKIADYLAQKNFI